MKNKARIGLLSTSFLLMSILLFQNCSKGFRSELSAYQNESLSEESTPQNDSSDNSTDENSHDTATIPQGTSPSNQVMVDTQSISTLSQFIPNTFTLFWPYPSRAYPEIPIDFQFIAYEAFKQPLTWKLVVGPPGMSLTAEGILKWTPTNSQIGTHAVTISVSRPIGSAITKSFSIDVNTTDFIFVATSGSDSATGTSSTAPLRTLFEAMRRVENGDGKTIYVRGGVYREHYDWETPASGAGPTRSKNFSSNDPLIISSYPGETFVLDCEFQGHGLWAYATSFVIFKNLEVRNASAPERAGVFVSESNNCVVQNVKVIDSDWDHSANVSGVRVEHAGDIVLDRITAINNKDRNSDHWNSSNYLLFTNGDGDIYVLDSYSSHSVSGFKIKHAGSSRLIIHGCTSKDDEYGFGGSSDYSSVRYSSFINSIQSGISLSQTDPNSFTKGAMLIEHNTIYNFGMSGIFINDNYSGEFILKKNIIATPSIMNKLFVDIWPYVTSTVGLRPFLDQNIFYAPGGTESGSALFSIDSSKVSLLQWQSQGKDIQSLIVNPNFVDTTNLSIKITSPAVFNNIEFAGAQQPTRP